MVRRKKIYARGFSLVETLVAITILTITIAATLSLSQQGLSTAFVAKEQVTAFYLAVEGMEFVRNRRDTNVLNGVGWLDGFGGAAACISSNPLADGCTVDVHSKLINSCTGICSPLLYDQTSNTYGYSNGGVETTFIRTVRVNEIVSDQEVNIIVTVSWRVGSFSGRDIVLEEGLLNWTGSL